MNKGLEALEKLTKIHNHNDFKECYKIIEKELKALEIIKKVAKNFPIILEEMITKCNVSWEDYFLIKEVLL